MTREDLARDLPHLLAFAKVITLNRAVALDIVREGVTAAARERPWPRGGQKDVYASVARRSLSARAEPERSAIGAADPLASSLLTGMQPEKRAEAFLVAIAGFSMAEARQIVFAESYRQAAAPPHVVASALADQMFNAFEKTVSKQGFLNDWHGHR